MGAALLAGNSKEDAHALATPFTSLGILFQMQDDVLDLFGNKGRAEVGPEFNDG